MLHEHAVIGSSISWRHKKGKEIPDKGKLRYLSAARCAKSETLAIQSPSGLDASPGVHSCISKAVVASGRLFSSTCNTQKKACQEPVQNSAAK